MSGNIGEKARAAFLALIMVTSVMAAGVAFTGSAVASSNDSAYQTGSAFVGANPVDTSTNNAEYTFVYVVGSGDSINGESIGNAGGNSFKVDFGVSAFNSPGDDSGNIEAVEHVDNSSGEVSKLAAPTDTEISAVSTDQGFEVTDFTAGGSADEVTLSAGDVIRVKYDNGDGGIDNSKLSNSQDIDISITSDSSTTSTTFTKDMTSGTFGVNNGNAEFDSFINAVENAGSGEDVSVPSGEFDETFRAVDTIAGGVSTASVSSDITITGQGATTSVISAPVDGHIIDINDNDDVTVENVGFSGQPIATATTSGNVGDFTISGAVEDSDGSAPADNLLITNISATNFDADSTAVINLADTNNPYQNFKINDSTINSTSKAIEVSSGGDGVTGSFDVDNNNIEQLGSNDGIVVSDASGDALINITSNTIESENNAINLATDGGGTLSSAAVDISDNDIGNTDNANGKAVLLSSGDNTVDVDIAGGSVDNVTNGIDASSYDGDNLNITNVEFTSIGSGTAVDISSANLDNSELDNFDITGDGSDTTGINLNDGSVDADLDTITINDVDTGVQIQSANNYNLTTVTVDGVNGGTAVDLTTGGTANPVTLDDISVENASSDKGLNVNDGSLDLDVVNSVINTTDVGVHLQAVSAASVRNSEIDNANTQAIYVDTPGANADIEINESTSIDQAAAEGIEIDLSDGQDGQFVDVDGITVNGSTGSGVKVTDLADADASDSDGPSVNITDSTISQNGIGLEVAGATEEDSRLNAHFNTFEQNTKGVEVADLDTSNGGLVVNTTFNDFLNNDNVGLEVADQTSGTVDSVNANYSYWGAPTGPDGDDSVSGAYGDGGNVTLNTDSDASVYPFLTESISQFSDAELNGDSFVVLENPQFPIEGTSNNQAIGVTVLEFGNSQATADNVTLSGPTGQRVLDDSTQLDPTTIEQFNLSSDVSAGEVTINAVSRADAISDGSVTQTVTGQFNASTSTLTDDNSQLQSGQTVNFTLQLNDDAGNAHEHQGVAVDFVSQNFGTAGVQFTDTEANTSNEGTATAAIAANGLNPGEDFTVRAFVGPDDDVFERTLTTATGAVDAGSSRLLLNDQPTDPATQQVNTTHDLAAQINDSQDNPVSGETVTFSSNASGVSFESTDVSTDSDGFANTTVTLPTDVGGVALNASAGDFSADTTGSARINVSTTAADASQLNVSDVSIAPGNSNPVTVSVQDEFGNLNTSTPDITLNTTDQSVISINGQQEATNTSTSSGQATFTVTAESDSGSATLTASASGLTADTATASIAEVGGVSLTADDSSIINDANSDNATNFTAEVTDADGNVIQTNESIRFTRVTSSSDAAASSTGAFEVFSGDDGTVTTFRANATGTGDTTFQANIPGTSFSDTATITSTGTADGLTIEANQSTVTAGDKVQINLSIVDTGDRVVPVSRSLSVDTTLGTLDSSGAATTVSTTDGEANVTLNATEAGTASVSVANSGLQTSVSTTITVEEDAPAYYTLELSHSIADRASQNTTNSTFSTHRKSGSTALLPRSVYRYTRTHTGGFR